MACTSGPNKLAWKLMQVRPGLGIENRCGIPEGEGVHWEEEFARAVGAPGAYDYRREHDVLAIHVRPAATSRRGLPAPFSRSCRGQGSASSTRLNGVAVERRTRENPPLNITSRNLASPA
jgi:hypothetical protein